MSLISLNLEYDRPAPADAEQRNMLENPSVSLASPAIWNWLSNGEPTASGELVNEVTALQTIAVYACVRVIAESVASLPLKLCERLKSGRSEATDEDLYDLLAVQPNSEMTAFTFWETLIGCLALTGNCYAEILRDRNGRPGEIYPLHPLKTDPFRTDKNALVYKTSDGLAQGQMREIASANMLHIPLFCFDGLKGLSPIQMARQGIGLTRAAEKFGARFFGNGSRPGGVLTLKDVKSLNPKQLSQVRESWASAQGGTNQGRTAVLPGEWTYTQIGLSPEDSQFLLTRKFQREDIAALFRVQPSQIGDTTRQSGTNQEQKNLEFVTDTIRPYTCRAEQEVTRKLLPKRGRTTGKFFVEFDFRERLKGDFASTMTGLAIGRQWGFVTANIALETIGQDPVGPEGDILLYPLNMGNATDLLNPPDQRQSSGTQGLQGQRNMQRFVIAYVRLFRDGVGRMCARNKRDLEAVSTIFSPVFDAITQTFEDDARSHFGLDATWSAPRESLIRAQCKGIERRVAEWTADKADEITGQELRRALTLFSVNIYREAGAAAAPVVVPALSAVIEDSPAPEEDQ
jgi:HK97 family phage portal protein